MTPQNAPGSPQADDGTPGIAEGSIGSPRPDSGPSRAIAECHACQEAQRNRFSGAYHANCRECSARALSHSPQFHDAQRAGVLTPAYRDALQAVFGDDWQAGHERVKSWAQRRAAT